jgi:hypothetical protein
VRSKLIFGCTSTLSCCSKYSLFLLILFFLFNYLLLGEGAWERCVCVWRERERDRFYSLSVLRGTSQKVIKCGSRESCDKCAVSASFHCSQSSLLLNKKKLLKASLRRQGYAGQSGKDLSKVLSCARRVSGWCWG